MDALDTLKALTSQMYLEPAEDADCRSLAATPEMVRKKDSLIVSHAVLPNGKRISLLKTLLTSACERNCNYCPFRAGRDFRRATFKPDDFARTFMTLHKPGVTEGVFLSSGVVNGGVYAQDQILKTAEILRQKHHYQGYLHLKIMPGAERAQLERAMQLADRISINLEAPNPERLELLAPGKKFYEELLQPMRWMDEIRRNMPDHLGWKGRWPSMVTQFVVGAAGDSDLELLSTTEHLNRSLHLNRAYFSAFHPIADTPFEDLAPESPLREHRLYQSSYLLRDYGFTVEDLPFEPSGSLPQHIDPKRAWADQHLRPSPVELNTAGRRELMRIPGIGPKGADSILRARRLGQRVSLSSLSELGRLGINPTRAAPYILLGGKRPEFQLPLPDIHS